MARTKGSKNRSKEEIAASKALRAEAVARNETRVAEGKKPLGRPHKVADAPADTAAAA